jgi:hypothetical protein
MQRAIVDRCRALDHPRSHGLFDQLSGEPVQHGFLIRWHH